ncbi:MAG: hypothetical protein RIQ81_1724 [Pseudomonadota bacterium]|jgi:hypothetical protein
MHELACPTCGTSAQYDFRHYLVMCPFCSETFKHIVETGEKEPFADHFIVPNTMAPKAVKDLILEWLRRLHHNPKAVDKEYVVASVEGTSLPFWIVSMEAHTVWTGLSQRRNKIQEHGAGSDFLNENGNFRRTYRWAVSARKNICEMWGTARLHEPKEKVNVDWDGFPMDSTFSRGHIEKPQSERSSYEAKEPFEFKFANGMPIAGVEVDEESAIRRAVQHVEHYHHQISAQYVDYLLESRSEIEVAGVQLVHLPFWHVTYFYRPQTALRHFYRPKVKHVLVEGYSSGVLHGQLAITRQDKIGINALVTGAAAIAFFMLGAIWHPAFFLVSAFSGTISAASLYLSAIRAKSASQPVQERPDESLGTAGLEASRVEAK